MRPPHFRKAAFPAAAFCSLALGTPGLALEAAASPATPKIPQGRYVPSPGHALASPAEGGDAAIAQANAVARVQPAADGFFNAVQRYAWSEGALYQVYAAPGQVTDIALQPGEALAGVGPVAAGDTARWIIGDAESGAGDAKRIHILVKPIARGLTTNLVINTDRRTYHLELRATTATYMAGVSWTYPQDELIALKVKASSEAAVRPVATGLDIAALNFAYRVDGDRPVWRPDRVFDDGRRTFIAFPPQVRQGELPPIFVVGAAKNVELVNFRVEGAYMVVDRIFDVAELRLGDKHRAQVVRITRRAAGLQR